MIRQATDDELAEDLCLVLLDKKANVDDSVTQTQGWVKKLYLGGKADGVQTTRPVAAQKIQKFMQDRGLTVGEMEPVFAITESIWKKAEAANLE